MVKDTDSLDVAREMERQIQWTRWTNAWRKRGTEGGRCVQAEKQREIVHTGETIEQYRERRVLFHA